MKYLNIVDNFEQNLKNNPQLMISSVNAYMKIIKELTNKYGVDPSVEQLNEFITYKCRMRQASTVQASIKHYIKFRWRNWNNIEQQLVKAKPRPIAKKKNFLTKSQSIDIINSINNGEHKLIAKIQYFTGARVSEVITIKKKDMIHEREYKRVRINIVGKGDKVNPIYLTDNILIDMQQCLLREGVYLFLKDQKNSLPEEQLIKKTESYYKRYYESIKGASKECGLDISTHDWRRSFSQSLRDAKVDIYDIKKALRHERIETTERYFKDEPEKIAKTMLTHQQGI